MLEISFGVHVGSLFALFDIVNGLGWRNSLLGVDVVYGHLHTLSIML